MEVYDKLWKNSRSFQKLRILLSASERPNNYLLTAFKIKCFGQYDTVTLTIPYLKVLHHKISQNSAISFSEGAIMS